MHIIVWCFILAHFQIFSHTHNTQIRIYIFKNRMRVSHLLFYPVLFLLVFLFIVHSFGFVIQKDSLSLRFQPISCYFIIKHSGCNTFRRFKTAGKLKCKIEEMETCYFGIQNWIFTKRVQSWYVMSGDGAGISTTRHHVVPFKWNKMSTFTINSINIL